MNNYTSNKPRLLVLLPFIIAGAIIFGMFLGRILDGGISGTFSVNTTGNTKLENVIDLIEAQYVDSIERDELVKTAIVEMLSELDPHSIYIPPRDLKFSNASLEGNFEGVGIAFNILRDTIVVVRPIPNGPSAKLGIRSGDRIIIIDGDTVAGTGITNRDVMKMLRGKAGTKVLVSIKRPQVNNLQKYTIIRAEIPLYSIDATYMMNTQTGYVKINRFSGTTYQEFITAAKQLKNLGMQHLILDLRDNPGGYLKAAINIADEFLKAGKLIVYTQGKARPKQTYYATEVGILQNTEVAVLINEGSASAAEIVAGALQDNDRAIIIGRRSFGKGLVQEQIAFADGSAIRLTVARYYTPTGRSIQRPYNGSLADYYKESSTFHTLKEDSLYKLDAKKFTTPAGKTVYGGGGILPNVYIKPDTTLFTPITMNIMAKSFLFSFAYKSLEKHRDVINNFTDVYQFIANKQLIDTIWQGFLKYLKANKIAVANMSKTTKMALKTRLLAIIARQAFNVEAYYKVVNRNDQAVQKAIHFFK